jgi:predicted dehydrogenase
MIKLAVAGVGGWGRNLARNYFQLVKECTLKAICDTDSKRLEQMQLQMPRVSATTRFEDLIEDPDLDAVVIATPAPTHYALAKSALLAGKDVYVEKPFVLDIAHGEELIEIARRGKRILMVGHLLEYHPVINRLKQMIADGELGDIYYIYNQRVNLGTVRADENAMWSLAPHDVSSILYLLGREPTDVAARGQCYLQKNIEDVVFVTMNFGGSSMAHIHVSWLDPHKIRKITVVGSKKMAVFDDGDGQEKLRIYDKGAAQNAEYNTYAEYITLRFGDVVIPYVKLTEPLAIECRHFIESVRTRKPALSDGSDGLRVIKVLDAAQRSLRQNGQPVSIGSKIGVGRQSDDRTGVSNTALGGA